MKNISRIVFVHVLHILTTKNKEFLYINFEKKFNKHFLDLIHWDFLIVFFSIVAASCSCIRLFKSNCNSSINDCVEDFNSELFCFNNSISSCNCDCLARSIVSLLINCSSVVSPRTFNPAVRTASYTAGNGALNDRKPRFTALIFTLFHRNLLTQITTVISDRFLLGNDHLFTPFFIYISGLTDYGDVLRPFFASL